MCSIGTPAASRIASYQPCAVLQGMAIAPQPARRKPSMPRNSHGSGSAPPLNRPPVRSGTRGSDQSTVGMWSWSRSAGVSSVRRSINCALASGPMPPSTPNILSFGVSMAQHCPHCGHGYKTMKRAIDLQGHRGARGLFPENTIAGFAGTLAIGVDTLELDVTMTRDDVVVVTHDARLNPDITRSADGPWLAQPGPPIRALRWAELAAYDVGRMRPGSRYAAQFTHQVPRDGSSIP